MEIFYDQANNHGVSLATAGAPDGVVIVEYDDIQFFGGSADTFDFEIVVWRTVDDSPGAPEIIIAYDNLNGSLAGPLTVGVENVDGTAATSLVNNDSAEGVLHNGLMVCFDLNAPSTDPVTITYAVTIDEETSGQTVVNTAVSTSSNIGSQEASTSVWVSIIPICTATAPTAGFSIALTPASPQLVLDWADFGGPYQVRVSTSDPYFAPASGILLASPTSNSYVHTTALGVAGTHHFYVVQANNCAGAADSARVGAFSFDLVPGK